MDTCKDSCNSPAASAALFNPELMALMRQAFRLEWMTVAWMVIEGAVAMGAGLAAGSLTLLAFGLDSVIELASAGVLIWRLNVELRHGQVFSERAERTASKIGGGLLFTLAAYIVAGAAWSFWSRHGAAFSLPGLIVALLAAPQLLTAWRHDPNAPDALAYYQVGSAARWRYGLWYLGLAGFLAVMAFETHKLLLFAQGE